MKDRLREKLRDFSQIPPLPESVNNVLVAIRDPRVSGKDITEMIAHDVSMTSKILKVVNSSYYGYRGKITSVTHAIVILGFNAVKNLILGLSMCSLLEKLKFTPEFDVKSFWVHCVGVACASKVIALEMGRENTEEFFTYGLVHDVGKLVMLALAPEFFLSLVREAKQRKISLYQIELEKGELPHTSVGYDLFVYWKMPEEITEIVGYHHDQDLIARKDNVRWVYWADQLIRTMGIGDGGDGNVITLDLEGVMGAKLERIKEKVSQELEKAQVFIEFLRGM